jgi:diguanylate cyclase (GGDEF)-like protein
MLENMVRDYRSWAEPARAQAMADAYIPILRGFLLPGSAYYAFVTWGHWRDESGWHFALLGGLSALTSLCYFLMRRNFLLEDKTSLARLEIVGLTTNLLMYTNVLVYMQVHFEPEKLIYFVLMAVVFSTSGITLRTTLTSITLSIGTLYWFALGTSPERFHQFVFIGVASSFAAFGMATLLRKAILRQIAARLAADKLAACDSLTGISNRRAIFSRLDTLIASNKPLWFGILDIDGFKSINDVYGHVVGDSLLCAVVERVSSMMGHRIALGRIGGDEFALFVEQPLEPEQIEAIGKDVIALINEPFDISLLRLSVGASIGFAQFPSTATSSGELYEKADFALYRAKRFSRGQSVIFNTGEERQMKENSTLERALREADLERELRLVFQPQVNIVHNTVRSFEALARWESPVLGSVRPDKFIRAAERAGLIQKVTRVLFHQGLAALATWPDDVSISFNLSAQDISDRAFIFSLVAEVRERQIAPQRVEFEITETAVMADIAASRTLLEDLSAAGFKIALDDFGSGYSSFEYIDQLPLDKVKIDKSFVQKVPHSATSREIVAGIIALCRKLGLACVLEGVETQEELQILSPLQPEIIQGYLFGRPMPAGSALELLRKQAADRDADPQLAEI